MEITRATTGAGNITIANKNIEDIKDSDGNNLYQNLNRDVNNSQQITKDLITGALDGSMTIDNRIFTSEGRSSIASDFKNFGSNALKQPLEHWVLLQQFLEVYCHRLNRQHL